MGTTPKVLRFSYKDVAPPGSSHHQLVSGDPTKGAATLKDGPIVILERVFNCNLTKQREEFIGFKPQKTHKD